MSKETVLMNSLRLSLSDLLGRAYTDAVCEARAFVEGTSKQALVAIAEEKVDLAPEWYRRRIDELVDHVGQRVCAGLASSAQGAGSMGFTEATNTQASPLTGLGVVRIGEDGRAYLIAKSEHYHASLGHDFPGFRLLDNARRLGIGNATHNNTRGHATRLLEEELIRVSNGIARGDAERLRQAIASRKPHVMNRVINLETGSLALEAAVKMMLARFYRLEESDSQPPYRGRIPVFLVIADRAGGRKANYHGTTILTQMMRDMWPGLAQALEQSGTLVVRPIRINDIAHFQQELEQYDRPPYKVAGFFHEIVLMNYGGIRLECEFLNRAYALCREHDVPAMVDEIQSCIWSPEMFMFREYGLQPDLVSVGKGFPGGQFAASRIIATSAMDNMHQFGALVTNGQEELAAIAYLVTLAYAEANTAYTRSVGDYYAAELKALAHKYPSAIARIEGWRHLSSVVFHSVEATTRFVAQLNEAGVDISAQTYKANCPPVALTKLPLVSTYHVVDFLIERMDRALKNL